MQDPQYEGSTTQYYKLQSCDDEGNWHDIRQSNGELWQYTLIDNANDSLRERAAERPNVLHRIADRDNHPIGIPFAVSMPAPGESVFIPVFPLTVRRTIDIVWFGKSQNAVTST